MSRLAQQTRSRVVLLLCLSTSLAACDSTKTGITPVGGEEVSPTEVERFVRRAHLDVTGEAATDDFVATSRDTILAASNSAAARGDCVRDLIADPRWSTSFADELYNRTEQVGGFDTAYAILCSNSRQFDPACQTCAPSSDPCAGCSCPALTQMLAERTDIENIPADLNSGTITTSQAERRIAGARGYLDFLGQAAAITALFEDFLGRPAEGDEIENGVLLLIGFGDGDNDPTTEPNNPSGLLFNRHGSNRTDLIEIIFSSDIYRDAIVAGVFSRYLGRLATPEELAHFTADLDAADPDIKEVTALILSSREYFGQ